jgi:bifunctional non-homologous end joining protein LigD
VGKVGTGFSEQQMKVLYRELQKSTPIKQPIREKVPVKDTVWVAPTLVCEVEFASRTQRGKLREPVFLRQRRDLSPDKCKD